MRSGIALPLLLLLACDDDIFGEPSKTGGEEGGEEGGDDSGGAESGWCAVQAVFNSACIACHSGASASGGLDLSDDPYDRIVGVASALYDGQTLVVPGDPDGSFLYVKAAGQQDSGQGSAMPPSAGLDADSLAVIAEWITEGASAECDEPVETGAVEPYHPEGFEEPEEHGYEAKYQVQACTDCHGEALDGGSSGVTCDTCHAKHSDDWRTDCVFCHGGTDNATGAPPRDISGETTASALSFSPHTTHVSDTEFKDAFACTACHVEPSDVLSDGHLFVGDSTAGVAEVDFSGGLSPDGAWDGTNTCSNVYCHGNGQDGGEGTASTAGDYDHCDSCHGYRDRDDWEEMSGAHEKHLEEGDDFDCGDCHKDVLDHWEPITDTRLHVNGEVNISLVSGMTWTSTGETCQGTCHDEYHAARWWYEDDDYARRPAWRRWLAWMLSW